MVRRIRFGDWCFEPDSHLLAMGERRHVLEPRVSRLLEFLLEHPGETLSHDRLVEAVWEGRVVSDEAVRRAISMLRHVLATGGTDHCIRTVHGKGYAAQFAAALPESSASGPAAPNGSADDAGAPEERPYAPPLWQRTAWALSVLLLAGALTLTLLAGRQGNIAPQPPPGARSTPLPTLAVLPFHHVDTDSASRLIADGVAAELLDALARYPGLRVTARASAFRFHDRDSDPRELGRELGVRYVLHGSVQLAEGQIHIETRLTDVMTGRQPWSGTHDRALVDLFALEQEIAADVAGALGLEPLAHDADYAIARKTDAETHLTFLRARELLVSWTVDDAEQAIALLQRAIALDPGYAAAYALMADAIMIRALSTDGVASVRETAKPLLDKAMALDPGLGEARVTRAWLIEDPQQQERELREGLALSPNCARGYEILAQVVMETPGRQDEALQLIEHALTLDPLSPRNHHVKAIFRAMQGDFEGAETLERRALAIDPRFRSALLWLGKLAALRGEFAAAVEYGERAVAIDPRATFLREALVRFYLAMGDAASASAVNQPAVLDAELAIRVFEHDWAGALTLAGAARDASPDTAPATQLESFARLGRARAGVDAAADAVALSRSLRYAGALPARLTATGYRAYVDLAQLLQASGDTATAARLRGLIEAQLEQRAREAPGEARALEANRALLLAQARDDGAALDALQRAFAPAPLPEWWLLLGHPAFDHLRDDPRLRAITARTEAHAARQRALLADMVRRGLVPERAAQNQR